MNKHQSNKGFTLVEVIVVAVIVAILAAVAIPLYTGYVNDSRVSLANSTAGTVASFLGANKNAGGTVTGYTAGTALVGPASISVDATKSVSIPAKVSLTVFSGDSVKATHTDAASATGYVAYKF